MKKLVNGEMVRRELIYWEEEGAGFEMKCEPSDEEVV